MKGLQKSRTLLPDSKPVACSRSNPGDFKKQGSGADMISRLRRIVNGVGMGAKTIRRFARNSDAIPNTIGAFTGIGTLVSNQIQAARKVRPLSSFVPYACRPPLTIAYIL